MFLGVIEVTLLKCRPFCPTNGYGYGYTYDTDNEESLTKTKVKELYYINVMNDDPVDFFC